MTMAAEISNAPQGLEAEMDEVNEFEEREEDEDYDEEIEGDVDQGEPHHGLAEVPEWTSLTSHPAATVPQIQQSLHRLAEARRSGMTVLLLGRGGVGKSHTANSLYADQVSQVLPFHMVSFMNAQPVIVRKRAGGVTFTAIDTPGLLESDSVSETNLRRVAFITRSNPVDVVLYVDRLEMPSVDDLEGQMFEGLTRTFGPEIWNRVVIGLTWAEVRNPPPGRTYASIVDKRVQAIQSAMRKAGAGKAELPFILIENSSRCQTNEAGEKLLPNGTRWVPTAFDKLVDVALLNATGGYKYDPKNVKKRENLINKFVIIPLVLVAQILLKVVVLDRIVEEDGVKGDRYGPFDKKTVEFEREKLRERKEREKEEREAAKERARKAKLKKQKEIEGTVGIESSSEEEEEYSDDDFDFE